MSESPFRSFDLGEGLLVLDRARHELAVLNPTAAIAWHMFEGGMSLEEVTGAFAAQMAVAPETVRADLAPLWQRRAVSDACRPAPQPPQRPWPAQRVAVTMERRVIVVESDDGDLLESLGGRLFHRRVPLRGEAPSILAVRSGDGYLCAAGQRVVPVADRERALGAVFEMLIALDRPDDPPRIMVHGAAVADDACSILLPGASGSGKSTLAAVLAAHGLTYLGDDLVGLDRHGAVAALPSALSVKAGRLDAFVAAMGRVPPPEAVFPGTAGHYVDPAWIGSAAASGPPVGLIVFPRFCAGASLEVETLAPAEALSLAMSGGLAVAPSTAADGAALLARLFASVPCRRVTYGENSPVASLIRAWRRDRA